MKTFLSIIVCFLTFTAVAQTKTTPPKTTAAPKKDVTCYDQWYAIFKERGANPVADGTHDVIISLRTEYGYAECFYGRIDVKEGKLASKLQVQKEDGSYEEFDKKVSTIYQNSEGVVREDLRGITNGMSDSFTVSGGDNVRLFFYKSIADKAKANKKAPNPAALIKN